MLKEILKNKRIKYLGVFSILVLFITILNISFSAFTQEVNKRAITVSVGNLKYQMSIDGVATDIITSTANNTKGSVITITDDNGYDTKYEVIYKVYSDSNCTNEIEKPEGLDIQYTTSLVDNIDGTIEGAGSKVVRLVAINNTNTTYYIKVGINSGFDYNELQKTNQINTRYKDGDVTLTVIIDNVESNTFPTTSRYTTEIECLTENGTIANAVGNAHWDSTNTKWLVDITGADTKTYCTVNFTTKNTLTLQEGIRENYPTISTPITVPGQAISASNEAILAETQDDYGTSYYFRGAVENNYVSFANMCWRIVRITGDGSIKLVLYNYESGDCTTEGASNAFARYDGTNYKTKFNSSYNKNAYVGFMYGTPGSSTYEAEHANNTDSTILTNLKTWYDAKLNINISQDSTKKYTDYLADTIWCNDKRVVTDTTYDPRNLGNILGTGVGTDKTYYAPTKRLRPIASASPSLKCGDTVEDNKISKFTASDIVNGNGKLRGINGVGDTEYKIGLLTVDEVDFAGGVYGKGNSTYYLNKNATDTWWLTMSPVNFNGSKAGEWYFYMNGDPSPGYVNDTGYGVRPAVSLKSTATISSGNGEAGTPFVISSN